MIKSDELCHKRLDLWDSRLQNKNTTATFNGVYHMQSINQISRKYMLIRLKNIGHINMYLSDKLVFPSVADVAIFFAITCILNQLVLKEKPHLTLR